MISSIYSVGDLLTRQIKVIYNKETSPLHLATPWVTVSRCCHPNFRVLQTSFPGPPKGTIL